MSSPERTHFIFEINFGESRIRHNDSEFQLRHIQSILRRYRHELSFEIHSRSMSDPGFEIVLKIQSCFVHDFRAYLI